MPPAFHLPFMFSRHNPSGMRRKLAKSSIARRLMRWTAMAAALVWCPLALGQGAPRNPGNYLGVYSVVVSGYWSGKGLARVGIGSVTIQVQVKNDAGQQGMLVAGLAMSDGYFHGSGTVIGTAITVSGRVDAADTIAPSPRPVRPNGPQRRQIVTDARLQATFLTGGTQPHGGRIAGARQ